jgi:hypothetical protein
MNCRRIWLKPGITYEVLMRLNRLGLPLPRAMSDDVDEGPEQAETRASHRSWAKGSARGAGPVQQQGTVRVRRDDKVIRKWLDALPPSCACGARKVRCDDCGASYCAVHGPHGCGGEGVQP